MTKLIERNTTIPTSKSQVFSTASRLAVAGRDPRPPGRARLRGRQQDARPVHPRRDPAGAARRAPDRGHVRHRCQRHPRRQGQGPGDRQGAAGPDHRLVDARQERRRPDGPRRPGARRGGRPRREEVETRNQAEALTFQAERTLKDLGDKVSSEDKLEVENQVASIREALKGSDVEAIKTGMTALAETLHRVSTAAYQASASAAGDGQGDGRAGSPNGYGRSRRGADGEPARPPRARKPSRASSRRSSRTSGLRPVTKPLNRRRSATRAFSLIRRCAGGAAGPATPAESWPAPGHASRVVASARHAGWAGQRRPRARPRPGRSRPVRGPGPPSCHLLARPARDERSSCQMPV